MNAEESINKWFAKFNHRMETEVPDIVAETATEFFKETFVKQSWDGVPWQALSTKWEAKKTRGKGQILRESGNLEASVKPSTVTPGKVVISAGNAKVRYARAHNEGLRIAGTRNIRPYTNNNFMGKGRPQPIKAHTRSVNYQMPKRQFMGHSHLLNKELKEKLIKAFNTK